MLIGLEIFQALQLGVLAYVISCVLMAQDYILEPYLDLLTALKNKSRVGKWLSYPLGLCEKCLGGQLGLWVWLKNNYSEYEISLLDAFLRHCIFISFVILFVILIKVTLTKWSKK